MTGATRPPGAEHRISSRTLAVLEASGYLRRLRIAYRADEEIFADLLELSRAAVRWQYRDNAGRAIVTGIAVDRDPAASLLTAAQAAALLGIGPDAVRRACREKRLAGVRPGRVWLIPVDEVARYAVRTRESKHAHDDRPVGAGARAAR